MRLWLIQFHDSGKQALVRAEDENGIREVVAKETCNNYHILRSLTGDDEGSDVFFIDEDIEV